MPLAKVSFSCALLVAAGLLSVSSCENANQEHCFDCGPCHPGDNCVPPELNGAAGASALNGAGGLQLNVDPGGETGAWR
jgi:hypothetical protein